MAERETEFETGDGGAAGIVAGLLIVALVVVGLFFFSGLNNTARQTIDLDLPAATLNIAPGEH